MAAGQTLWVAIVLSISAQIRGQTPVVSPPSVAATNGDQNITINCTVQDYVSGDIAWGYKPLWNPNSFIVIYNSTFIDATNYSVDVYDYQWQGSRYRSVDLTIKSAKPGQAATYACMLSVSFNVGHSSFIVLDPLQCPAQDLNEYVEGTTVSISCSVVFYHKEGFGSPPDINIYKGGILLQGATSVISNTKTVTVNQTLRKEDDNVDFVCLLSFANDSPDYSDNCSVVYYVKHEVSEIIFYPPSSSSNLTSIPVGGQITCDTNGRPPPIITWYNDGGNLIGEGNNLTVTDAMLSWAQPVSVICRANNTINSGLNYTSVSANYTFLVVGAPPPPVQSSAMEAWKIALCVIIPVLVITAIAIAVFFIIRHRKKKKKKAKKATNGSTIYNATTATATATTASTTSYSPVATSDPTYASSNRPPPASAIPLTSSALGPPGFDGRHDSVRQSPGFGDLGAQPYGGSSQAVNAYPTRNSSVHGSSQAIGVGAGLSMNPYPGYQGGGGGGGAARASNPALNASTASRPMYPYKGSNPHLDVSLSLNPQHSGAVGGAGYGRESSLSSASSAAAGRSVASGYNPQAMHGGYPNDLSSMPGSEV